MFARHRSQGRSRRFTTGEGSGFDAIVGDNISHGIGSHQQGLKHPCRETRLGEHLLNGGGAAGHIGGMFEHCHIPCHEGGGGKAKDLPEGKVPGHHRQHNPQGLIAHKALTTVGLARYILQKAWCLFSVKAADPSAFHDLSDRAF